MKKSIIKTNVMVFRGKELVRIKIIIDDKIIEQKQVRHFNFTKNYIGYDKNYRY